MPMLYLKLKITFFFEKPAFKLKYGKIKMVFFNIE